MSDKVPTAETGAVGVGPMPAVLGVKTPFDILAKLVAPARRQHNRGAYMRVGDTLGPPASDNQPQNPRAEDFQFFTRGSKCTLGVISISRESFPACRCTISCSDIVRKA